MKNHLPMEEPSGDEMATTAPDEARENDIPQGRSGEGSHSAMKHWLLEERDRIKRPEH